MCCVKERKGAHLIIDVRREEGETDRRSGVLSIKSHLISHRFICYCCPKTYTYWVCCILCSRDSILLPTGQIKSVLSQHISDLLPQATPPSSLASSVLPRPLWPISPMTSSLSLSPPIFLCFLKSVLEICSYFRIYPHIHFLCMPHLLSQNVFRVIGFLSTSYQPTADVPLLVQIDRSITQTENRCGSVSSLS